MAFITANWIVVVQSCLSSNHLARSLQICEMSLGERNYNRCWYLHLYSVNIKSKQWWYPNISFELLQCSIIPSPHSPHSLHAKYSDPFGWDNDRHQVEHFHASIENISGTNWDFIYSSKFQASRTGSESGGVPCLHYKKIIRNIVINLIIKPKYIYIYQEIKPARQIFGEYSVVKIYILKERMICIKYNPICRRLFNDSKHKEKLVKPKVKSGLSWISTTTNGLSR